MADMDSHDKVCALADPGYHGLCLFHDLLPGAEYLLQLFLRSGEVTGIIHGVPSLLASQEPEDGIPCLVVCHLPRQVLIPSPSLGQPQEPWLPEGVVDEGGVKQMGEVLDGPVVEDDDHLLPFRNTHGDGR